MMDMQMEVMEQPFEDGAVALIHKQMMKAGVFDEDEKAVGIMAMKKVRVDLFLGDEPVFLEVERIEEIEIRETDDADE
jgi:hypothetical protein